MREIKFKAVMQRLDGVKYVSEEYSIDNGLSYLFDFEHNRWDIFLERITTEKRFVELYPDEDEDLKGWSHIENIQYTGLKDKNKEEIYEGDILKDYDNDQIGVVSFENGEFIVIYENEAYPVFEWSGESIIGNIYENTELLEVMEEGEN